MLKSASALKYINRQHRRRNVLTIYSKMTLANKQSLRRFCEWLLLAFVCAGVIIVKKRIKRNHFESSSNRKKNPAKAIVRLLASVSNREAIGRLFPVAHILENNISMPGINH